MTAAQKLYFVEAILIGIIDGIVAYFSFQCYSGLIGFVGSAFRMIDHY